MAHGFMVDAGDQTCICIAAGSWEVARYNKVFYAYVLQQAAGKWLDTIRSRKLLSKAPVVKEVSPSIAQEKHCWIRSFVGSHERLLRFRRVRLCVTKYRRCLKVLNFGPPQME